MLKFQKDGKKNQKIFSLRKNGNIVDCDVEERKEKRGETSTYVNLFADVNDKSLDFSLDDEKEEKSFEMTEMRNNLNNQKKNK